MAKLTTEELIAAFKELTLVEVSEFVKAFEEEFDVTAAAPVAAVAAASPALLLRKRKRRTPLTSSSSPLATRRLQAVKEVRALTSLGLKEAGGRRR